MKLFATAAISAFVALGASAMGSSAHAAEWRLDPRLCPDLREDRRDARVTTSRRDRREDRRDQRVTNCPASALTFVGSSQRFDRGRDTRRVQRPAFSRVIINQRGQAFGVYRNGDRVRINLARY